MPKWLPDPKLDENAKVGLSFIGIGYGVALVAVFPMTRPVLIGLAGWFHLALAAFMLVVSYMGYYSNRQEYPEWRIRFFNIPLLQYLISFGILFLYWELGITLPRPGREPTPFSEAVIFLIVFVAYLVWDCLEVIVQESKKYIRALTAAGQDDMLPPWSRYYRQGLRSSKDTDIKTWIRWDGRTKERFARDVRARRAVTFFFSCLYGLILALTVWFRWRGTAAVIIADVGFILSLFVYRYLQWWWSGVWYHRRPPPAAGEASMSRPRSRAGLE